MITNLLLIRKPVNRAIVFAITITKPKIERYTVPNKP